MLLRPPPEIVSLILGNERFEYAKLPTDRWIAAG